VRDRRPLAIGAALLLLALVPPLAGWLQQPFYLDLLLRAMIYAIAALSLDLILGYGGMVSFGHAAYLGLGAYTVAILAFYGVTSGPIQFAAAILVSAAAALVIGFVSLRTSGVYFIMITLAFAQMLYFLSIGLDQFGGDNGMSLPGHSDFGRLLDLDSKPRFYYFVFALLLAALWLCRRIVNSRFGMVIQGARSNERRMASLGFATFRYKLAAFVIAGALCGLAGALLANQALYVAPAILHWERSGELMVMVILGGMGTLFGPVLGAVIFLLLENLLADLTDHWQIIFGPLLILVVLFAKGGLFGLVTPAKGTVQQGTSHG
jgi:branched-chain amino acid transport system permease protein